MSELKAKYDTRALYQLEHYLFQLLHFIISPEFYSGLDSQKQEEVLQEIYQMNYSIGTIRGFLDIPKETKHVAWQVKQPYHGHKLIYTFSSENAVRISLGMTDPKVFEAAHWNRKKKNGTPHEGWYVMKLTDYLEDACPAPEEFEPNYLINHIQKNGTS